MVLCDTILNILVQKIHIEHTSQKTTPSCHKYEKDAKSILTFKCIKKILLENIFPSSICFKKFQLRSLFLLDNVQTVRSCCWTKVEV